MPPSTAAELNYVIKGHVHQTVEVHLEHGQRVFSEVGGMIWMDDHIETDTRAYRIKTGLFSGEELMLNYFTARNAPGCVTFSPSFPGSILAVRLNGNQNIIAQRGSFLCAQSTCDVRSEFKEKVGIYTGVSLDVVLRRINGPGTFFLEINGEATTIDLQPKQRIKVDVGHIAAFEETVDYDFRLQKMSRSFFGAEKMMMARLTGPGRVWLQNQTVDNLANALAPYLVRSGAEKD